MSEASEEFFSAVETFQKALRKMKNDFSSFRNFKKSKKLEDFLSREFKIRQYLPTDGIQLKKTKLFNI